MKIRNVEFMAMVVLATGSVLIAGWFLACITLAYIKYQ